MAELTQPHAALRTESRRFPRCGLPDGASCSFARALQTSRLDVAYLHFTPAAGSSAPRHADQYLADLRPRFTRLLGSPVAFPFYLVDGPGRRLPPAICCDRRACRKGSVATSRAGAAALVRDGRVVRVRAAVRYIRCPDMSNFAFLQAEWPAVFEAAEQGRGAAHPDPRTACFYARRALELAVAWLYKHDPALRLPYQDNLSALIHEPTFKAGGGRGGVQQGPGHQDLGNQAVHSHAPIQPADALTAIRELFHVCYWLARTYARGVRSPPPGLAFDPDALPKTAPIPTQTVDQLQKLEAALRERDEKLSALLADKTALDEELQAPARRGGRGEEGERGPARHPRLFRGRDPRLLHRPAAQGGRLAARPAARPRVRSHRHAQQRGQGLRRLRAVGRRRQAARRWSRPSAPSKTRTSASSRPSSTPTAWRSSSASARSSSTPTATSTGSGTTPATRRARCRASTRRPSWNC